MAKLTKEQRKAHAEAQSILTKDRLTEDEIEFVFRNWHEGAEFINGAAGAFFTPYDLAGDFALDGAGGRVIDLCAGIGVLSYFVGERARSGSRMTELTCVEINPKYCEVGRKLLPYARWINADVFDWRALDLGRYDIAIANPPFGRVRRSGNGPRYQGVDFEFHVIDIAAELADHGAFILPQQSASFQYSGRQYYERRKSGKGIEFEKATGFEMACGAGVDTSIFKNDWKDTSIITEIACFDFTESHATAQAQKLMDAVAGDVQPQRNEMPRSFPFETDKRGQLSFF